MKRGLLALVLLAGGPGLAQDIATATGGQVRVLDKLTASVTDLDLAAGEAGAVGKLSVVMDECRYPSDNPAAEAYAHLTIRDAASEVPVFSGWMMATSPALSALDHPRYDVWVLRCDLPS